MRCATTIAIMRLLCKFCDKERWTGHDIGVLRDGLVEDYCVLASFVPMRVLLSIGVFVKKESFIFLPLLLTKTIDRSRAKGLEYV